ncbi:MAG TPA: molybdopterin-dependent oxidoreductase [Mycobacteriales bacterium]|nr:molybdopterin-dependent oxidoreductase [Mycobacteriales bacterium]
MTSDDGKPVGRRIVLGMLGAGLVGVTFGKELQDLEQRVLAPVQSRDPTGLSGLVPDGGGFRFYSVTSSIPKRTAEDYRLTVGGHVDRPMTLTMADLHAMKQTSLTRDFQCVTGWRVPNVHWSGVALPDLLDHVGVQSAAKAVKFTSFDGEYTESLTLEQARRRDVLVATSMLGGPVSRNHGGPVRLYVAPMYGYKSCKWLGGIQLTPGVETGYWEHLGYDVDGWVGKSNGRDDAPTS